MAKESIAYENMRRALFEAVRAIPGGMVVDFRELAAALNIPPRHVAYILSRLTDDEAEAIPWHRVVPKGGDFGRPGARKPLRERQILLLRAEGHEVMEGRYVQVGPGTLWQPDDRHRATIWADAGDL